MQLHGPGPSSIFIGGFCYVRPQSAMLTWTPISPPLPYFHKQLMSPLYPPHPDLRPIFLSLSHPLSFYLFLFPLSIPISLFSLIPHIYLCRVPLNFWNLGTAWSWVSAASSTGNPSTRGSWNKYVPKTEIERQIKEGIFTCDNHTLFPL